MYILTSPGIKLNIYVDYKNIKLSDWDQFPKSWVLWWCFTRNTSHSSIHQTSNMKPWGDHDETMTLRKYQWLASSSLGNPGSWALKNVDIYLCPVSLVWSQLKMKVASLLRSLCFCLSLLAMETVSSPLPLPIIHRSRRSPLPLPQRYRGFPQY